jgi:hypothetical protein
VGTTNTCELPVNVVSFDKPNMLTGLNQKVCGEERSLKTGPPWTNHRRRRGRVRPARRVMRNRVNPKGCRKRQVNREEH